MNITPCLLDTNNSLIGGGVTLGSLVAAAGKLHLWESRRCPETVDVIVIHSVSGEALNTGDPFDTPEILKIFCNYGVSSHYLIERSGAVLSLVPEGMKAWHAGGSVMPEPDNRRAVNEFSIGIELTGSATSGFTELQYCSLVNICAAIERRYGGNFTYVGHEHVAGLRAVELGLRQDIKTDPGPAFEWSKFFKRINASRGGTGNPTR